MFPTVVVIILAHIGACAADFACVCNYKEDVIVYSKDNVSSAQLGKITGWECKQILSMAVASQWLPVAFEHQVGYVQSDPKVLMQMCTGLPSVDDKITTTVPSTSTSAATTTTTITTTTGSPVTATSTTQTTTQTTTIPTTSVTTQHHQTSTVHKDPHTIANHYSKLDGDVSLCPENMISTQSLYNDAIGQFGHKCYGLALNLTLTWPHANENCNWFGGSLLHIENEAEQEFVTGFVQRHTPNQPVWLGLNDRLVEGMWHWSSGGAPGYRNWMPGHRDPLYHKNEDCAILDPRRNGQWEEVKCGAYFGVLHTEFAPAYYAPMCQFHIKGPYAIFG